MMTGIEILFTAIGTLILLLLSIVGFFLSQHIHVVKELIKTVENLSTVVAVLKNNVESSTIMWKEKHSVIDDRLKTHGDDIDDNTKQIIRIKEHLHMT